MGSIFTFLHVGCASLFVFCLTVYFGDISISLHIDQPHSFEHLLTIILYGCIKMCSNGSLLLPFWFVS